MSDQPASPQRPPSAILPRTARQATIDRLRQPLRRSGLGYTALATLGAFRLLALCAHSGLDPVVELARRFECLETTRLVLAFAERAAACWPDKVMVLRPCCIGVSPDEQVLARMTELALAGDRAGFADLLHGFIRSDRHDDLFDHAARLAAALNRPACAPGL